MKKLLKFLIIVSAVIIWHTSEAFCQPGQPGFISPEVRKDRTVTFRYLAPNSKDVKLSSQFMSGPQYHVKRRKWDMEHYRGTC